MAKTEKGSEVKDKTAKAKAAKAEAADNAGKADVKTKVEKAITKLRPNLQADGGDIELVDVKDGIAKVRLQGACAGCPMSQLTLKMYVESVIKKDVPEITKVEQA